MRLNDLRVETIGFAEGVEGQRHVTFADLVEVIKDQGGEVVQARQETLGWKPVMRVMEPGRYLVLRLPDELKR